MRGFAVFLGAILRIPLALLAGVTESVLVLVRLKRVPPTGPARWRWKR
jgi:hypothetical protein